MRMLLSTIGSRGDVQPLAALAVRLQALGQEARVCAPPDFRGWIEGLGIPFARYIGVPDDIYCGLSKHLVDIDDQVLGAARAELGTDTIKETVNEALRRASENRPRQVDQALDTRAKAQLADRDEAWH